jgi:hypothetical protein
MTPSERDSIHGMQVEKALRRTQGRVMLAADMLLEKQARKEARLKAQQRRKRLGLDGITGTRKLSLSLSKP